MKTCLLLLIITFGVLCVPVEGCMRGGIPPAGAAGIIALCVIFSPVLLVVGTGMAAREGVRKIKRHGERRRVTSNVIRKQRNRMIKKVGAKNFDNYLQDLYDRAKTEASPDLYTELGTAFFLNNDLIHANDWLTKALEFPNITTGVFKKRGAAYFMRGMVNQYLYDFVQAVEDFREAQKYLDSNRTTTGEGGAELPQLTVQDAVNAAGFAKMMQAIYVASDDEERIRGLLSDAITDMTTAIDTTKELQGMYFHNRGFARYHRTYYLPADQTSAELELAVADFNTAIGSGNFGTTAEGHSMKSQCLARLGRIEEGLKEQEAAIQLDDKVFTVELTDEVALKVPWPLPADKYKNNSANHRFQETSFKMPHYCSHCSQLIKKGKGFECYACNFRCHTHCQPKVADKDCWELMKMEKFSVTLSEQSYGNVATEEQLQMNHIHHLSAVHFNKPTWCGLCSKLVASPFGKQGYRCTDCGVKIHKDCLGIAGSHIIEN